MHCNVRVTLHQTTTWHWNRTNFTANIWHPCIRSRKLVSELKWLKSNARDPVPYTYCELAFWLQAATVAHEQLKCNEVMMAGLISYGLWNCTSNQALSHIQGWCALTRPGSGWFPSHLLLCVLIKIGSILPFHHHVAFLQCFKVVWCNATHCHCEPLIRLLFDPQGQVDAS